MLAIVESGKKATRDRLGCQTIDACRSFRASNRNSFDSRDVSHLDL